MEPTTDCPWTTWMFNWSRPGSCYQPDSIAETVVRNSIFEPWVEDAKRGVQDVIKTMITFWIDIPDPDVGTVQGVANPVITFLQDRLVWLGAVIMCFVMAFKCAQIMWEGNKSKPMVDVAKMVMVYLSTAALMIPVAVTGLAVTNYVAQNILEMSTAGDTNFADNVFGLFANEAGLASSILIILMYIVAMLISGLMCVIMIGRGAAFFVILGGLLLQTTGYATDSGKEGFQTSIGWLKGLLLYDLVAAAIFGVGFRFLSTDTSAAGNGLLQMLYGLTLLLMAVFALPATMRITAPATTPVASGSGAGETISSAGPMLVAGMIRR
jgi:type IV secretion system protein TrbL